MFRPGDTDGDLMVGQPDLLTVIGNWGGSCAACPWCPGDLNGDGAVDLTDLLQVIGQWGMNCDPCGESASSSSSSMMMSSVLSSSFSSSSDEFQAVLDEWGFENWDEAAAWMAEASAEEVAAFLDALSDLDG